MRFINKILFIAYFILLIPFSLILFTSFKNKIKFLKIRRDVIGNAVTELYLYLNLYKKKNKYHYFFFDDNYICNEYYNQICKKNLNFFYFGRIIFYLSKKLNFLNKFIIQMPTWYALKNYKPKNLKKINALKFSKVQNKAGNFFFNEIGIKKNTKVIGLIIRDDYYKNNFSNTKNRNWNYHSYRNADLKSYLNTIKYLNKKGYFVIRMGKGSNTFINYKNNLYFDYARSNLRSDFLDFWIISNTYFCITTGTGIDELCSAYHVPTVDTNFLPIGHVRSAQNFNITIFKKIKNISNKKIITLSESIKNQLFYRPQILYKKNSKYNWIDNTPKEILEATKEMEQTLSKKIKLKKIDLIIQKKFWNNFNSLKNFSHLYSKSEQRNIVNTHKHKDFFKSYISNFFLKKNPWLLK